MQNPIGLFYGTTTGATETVAESIVEKAKAYDVEIVAYDVSRQKNIDLLVSYDKLILGTSTWYYGEHQGDWEDLLDLIPSDADFQNKTVALFGLGDQEGYPDWYLDAMGMIADEFEQRGATIIGDWSADGYDFDESKALREDGRFVGLAIDDDCQPKLTEERVNTWLADVLPQFKAL